MVTGTYHQKRLYEVPVQAAAAWPAPNILTHIRILVLSNMPPDGAAGIITLTKELYKWYKTQLSALFMVIQHDSPDAQL